MYYILFIFYITYIYIWINYIIWIVYHLIISFIYWLIICHLYVIFIAFVYSLQRSRATPRLVTEISQLAELGDVMLTVAEIDEERAQGAKILWEDIQSQMECWQGDMRWIQDRGLYSGLMLANNYLMPNHVCLDSWMQPPWVYDTLQVAYCGLFTLQLGVYLLGRIMPMQNIDIETRQTVQEQLKSDTSVPADVWEPRLWQWQRGCLFQRELMWNL